MGAGLSASGGLCAPPSFSYLYRPTVKVVFNRAAKRRADLFRKVLDDHEAASWRDEESEFDPIENLVALLRVRSIDAEEFTSRVTALVARRDRESERARAARSAYESHSDLAYFDTGTPAKVEKFTIGDFLPSIPVARGRIAYGAPGGLV